MSAADPATAARGGAQEVTARELPLWEALAEVADPEIPAVSVVDMGMIERAELDDQGRARVTVLPTFTGCPAIDVIKQDVASAIARLPEVTAVEVDTTFDPPWTTARISAEGRAKLQRFGLAPPTGSGPVLVTNIGLPQVAICPFCKSRDTRNENPFGPTPCRALYYCNSCRNPFEQFKPV